MEYKFTRYAFHKEVQEKNLSFTKEGFLSSYVESHSDGAFNLFCVIGKKLLFQ